MSLHAAADVPLLISSPNASSERRINPSWTIAFFKTRLEPITGIPAGCQQLTLRVASQDAVSITADDEEQTQLGAFSLQPYAEISVSYSFSSQSRLMLLPYRRLPHLAVLDPTGRSLQSSSFVCCSHRAVATRRYQLLEGARFSDFLRLCQPAGSTCVCATLPSALSNMGIDTTQLVVRLVAAAVWGCVTSLFSAIRSRASRNPDTPYFISFQYHSPSSTVFFQSSLYSLYFAFRQSASH